MPAPLSALLALSALAASARASSFTTYRTAEDDAASLLATTRAAEECANVDLSGVDEEGSRKALERALGGQNIVMEILTDAESPSEFATLAQEKVTVPWLIRIAGPMVFSFILVAVWAICCWTFLPPCRCCRVCKRQRRVHFWMKLTTLVALGGLLFGMFVCAMYAIRGKADIEEGLNSITCTSARVVATTLNGDAAGGFIGMLPLLDEFGVLRSKLNDNSEFLNTVTGYLSNTTALEQAQFVSAKSLKLLEDTLDHPLNQGNALTRDAMDALVEAVRKVNEVVSDGLGMALTNARDMVHTQLSPANRATLRDELDVAVTPLRTAATTMRDSTQLFIKDDFKTIKIMAIRVATAAIISIALLIFLVAACGCSSAGCCIMRERKEAKAEDGKNPWNSSVHRCAACTWCWGWLYAFMVFFFGGFMIICSVPMSSVCLVMDDINGEMLRDILPALGGPDLTSGDQFTMITDLIDTCFSKQDSGDKTLMDTIFFVENGTRKTLKQVIKGQFVDPLKTQFSQMDSQMSGADFSLANNPGVSELKQAFANMSAAIRLTALPSSHRCDIFQTSSGADCDVMSMSYSAGAWINDCVYRSGGSDVMTPKDKLCSSAQFADYLDDWATRIDKVFTRVDDAVNSTKNSIATGLQLAVDDVIIAPVTRIMDQASCNFLKSNFRDLVKGFCYRGVVGFSTVAHAYIGNGVLTIFLVLLAYIMWRVSIDNHNSWKDEVHEVIIDQRMSEDGPGAGRLAV